MPSTNFQSKASTSVTRMGAWGVASLVVSGWLLASMVACNGTDMVSSAPRKGEKDGGGGEADSGNNELGSNEVDGGDSGDGADSGDLDADGDGAGDLIDETVLGSDGDEAHLSVPRFGLLVNDLECALCHVKIHGDVASTENVSGLWADSTATVTGTWYAAKDYDVSKTVASRPNLGVNIDVTVVGGVKKFHSGDELPNDVDSDGSADFPALSVSKLASNMSGRVETEDESVTKVHDGNLVLIGTAASPIKISGEVLVKGDLVIKGVYRGIGNLYVMGNIYIPADLKAKRSAFPFPEDEAGARAHARAAIKDKKDALGLATPKSIFISDIEDHGSANHSVYTHPATPDGRTAAQLGVEGVYGWYPRGKSGFEDLYEGSGAAADCDSGKPNNQRTFSLVEAYLFAGNTIGGRANRNSYAINGGIIADHFHIISAARHCGSGTHAVHGYPSDNSHVAYDYRMREGLLLLKQLASYFRD